MQKLNTKLLNNMNYQGDKNRTPPSKMPRRKNPGDLEKNKNPGEKNKTGKQKKINARAKRGFFWGFWPKWVY